MALPAIVNMKKKSTSKNSECTINDIAIQLRHSECNSNVPIICEVCLTICSSDKEFRKHAIGHAVKAGEEAGSLIDSVHNAQFEAEIIDFWKYFRVGRIYWKGKKSSWLIQCIAKDCGKLMLSQAAIAHILSTGHSMDGVIKATFCEVCGEEFVNEKTLKHHARMHVAAYLKHMLKHKGTSASSREVYNNTFDMEIYAAFGQRLALIFTPDDSGRLLVMCNDCDDFVATTDRITDHRRRKNHSIIYFKHTTFTKSSSANASPRVRLVEKLAVTCKNAIDDLMHKSPVIASANTKLSKTSKQSVESDVDVISESNEHVMMAFSSRHSNQDVIVCEICSQNLNGYLGLLQHAECHLKKFVRRNRCAIEELVSVMIDSDNNGKKKKIGRIFANSTSKRTNNYLIGCARCQDIIFVDNFKTHMSSVHRAKVSIAGEHKKISSSTNDCETEADKLIDDVDNFTEISIIGEQNVSAKVDKNDGITVTYGVEEIDFNEQDDDDAVDLSFDSVSEHSGDSRTSKISNDNLSVTGKETKIVEEEEFYECSKCLQKVLVAELILHSKICRSNSMSKANIVVDKNYKIEDVFIDCNIELEDDEGHLECCIPLYDYFDVQLESLQKIQTVNNFCEFSKATVNEDAVLAVDFKVCESTLCNIYNAESALFSEQVLATSNNETAVFTVKHHCQEVCVANFSLKETHCEPGIFEGKIDNVVESAAYIVSNVEPFEEVSVDIPLQKNKCDKIRSDTETELTDDYDADAAVVGNADQTAVDDHDGSKSDDDDDDTALFASNNYPKHSTPFNSQSSVLTFLEQSDFCNADDVETVEHSLIPVDTIMSAENTRQIANNFEINAPINKPEEVDIVKSNFGFRNSQDYNSLKNVDHLVFVSDDEFEDEKPLQKVKRKRKHSTIEVANDSGLLYLLDNNSTGNILRVQCEFCNGVSFRSVKKFARHLQNCANFEKPIAIKFSIAKFGLHNNEIKVEDNNDNDNYHISSNTENFLNKLCKYCNQLIDRKQYKAHRKLCKRGI